VQNKQKIEPWHWQKTTVYPIPISWPADPSPSTGLHLLNPSVSQFPRARAPSTQRRRPGPGTAVLLHRRRKKRRIAWGSGWCAGGNGHLGFHSPRRRPALHQAQGQRRRRGRSGLRLPSPSVPFQFLVVVLVMRGHLWHVLIWSRLFLEMLRRCGFL